jgi:hypothetical protein
MFILVEKNKVLSSYEIFDYKSRDEKCPSGKIEKFFQVKLPAAKLYNIFARYR